MLDRMPDGEFIGRVKIWDVAKASSPMMFYNKVPFRDFVSPEFLLAQGKGYGLDIQRPAYFFVNSKDEWGALIEVIDSSKILNGIERLRKNVELVDTIVSEHKAFVIKSEKIYFAYDKNWLFMYKGTQFPKRMYHVKFAEKGGAKVSWQAFRKEPMFFQNNITVYSNSKELKKLGLETAIFTHDSDSSSIRIKTYVRNSRPLGITKKDSGMAFVNKGANEKLINLHLNINELRTDKENPIYRLLSKYSKKISFPLDEFLAAWEGDLSFHQGGTVKVKESYIETVMDDNFNLAEIKSFHHRDVPGFSFFMSCNEHQKTFLNLLFARGILRKDEEKYYLLTSPPLKIMQTKSGFYLYSSPALPKMAYSGLSGGYWKNPKGIRYEFSVDSISRYEFRGSFSFPVEKLLKSKKIF